MKKTARKNLIRCILEMTDGASIRKVASLPYETLQDLYWMMIENRRAN